jgi:hypothetical protein
MSRILRPLIVFFIVAFGLGWQAILGDARGIAERPTLVTVR